MYFPPSREAPSMDNFKRRVDSTQLMGAARRKVKWGQLAPWISEIYLEIQVFGNDMLQNFGWGSVWGVRISNPHCTYKIVWVLRKVTWIGSPFENWTADMFDFRGFNIQIWSLLKNGSLKMNESLSQTKFFHFLSNFGESESWLEVRRRGDFQTSGT